MLLPRNHAAASARSRASASSGTSNRERAAELLVQRGDDQRQRRFRNARAGRQRRGELLQALGLQKLAHEREEGGTLFDISDMRRDEAGASRLKLS